ncbi:MAG: single-stranded-DNA-specific exonuclease RecJ [Daejeonella sp.]|uniref:single-stranded-DNA-specific exonuclease RecJ n=1 Tax=Daejeonella sp. TaxID=2805397 RepID=UPI0027341E21|nr:single-stranded-DNA-specific exonuclease RecJ [Daejeonella sp.]MDP3467988.1 single-stranded-DNA-specific exonuclease RecJ [Daejeonella sp.]
MQKRWVEREIENLAVIAELQESLKIDRVLASLLVKRGITNYDEARDFFRPELNKLHDPYLMQDMARAVSRINQAITSHEKILIYGDYDVDGTTSVALTYSFLKKLYSEIDFYIPDRYREGYGISTQGIDYAFENGYSLIIALDCGIKSVDKIDYANERGIDFIICDHHLPGDQLPAAIAVLDPKRKDCNYPYKELSGCGIGFKLIQAYALEYDIAFEQVSAYLDLVAVSIASDIVPITGENRILAWYGLLKLNTDPCKGLSALMNISGRKENLSIMDVVFTIGPRINAAGRIDDAKHSVNLLIAEDEAIALENSQIINTKNTERKEHDSNITEQALAMIDGDPLMISRKTTVVYSADWHKGVIGIVASRLTEKYYRPTIVMTNSNGYAAGSARSVAGFDLYEALCECSDLLIQFGGHKYAAGLTMKTENIPAFQQRFEEVVAASIPEELLVQAINIDAEIELKQIDPKFFRILKQFEPFGPQNMVPVFVSRNVYTYGAATIVGSNHLKMCVHQDNQSNYNCIGFGLGEYLNLINSGRAFDICYTIEENTWKEKKSIQLNIKGIRAALPNQGQ